MLRVAAIAVTLMILSTSASARDFHRVRTTSPRLHALVATARVQSPTFARMLETIERSNVIVYLEAEPHLDRGLWGCVHFVGASGAYRYLRIRIRTGMDRFDVIASLAHELRHAIEIADHPEVRDEAGLLELYRRIGSEHNRRMFETADAQRAGRAVRAEVIGP